MNRRQLKGRAKQAIFQPRRPHLILVTLLYILIGLILTMIVSELSDIGQFQAETSRRMIAAAEDATRLGVMDIPALPQLKFSIFGTVFLLVPLAFLWIIDLGYRYYVMGVTKDEVRGYQSLFEGFRHFAKALAARLIYTVLVSVGFLFFLAPGIVAICAFSQIDFLLLDNPTKGVFWFFGESARLMRGRKKEYFVLTLSFLGWRLLTRVPLISLAALFWYTPYSTCTFAYYYHDLSESGPKTPGNGWRRPGMY